MSGFFWGALPYMEMILCTDSMSVDPDDRTPAAIKSTGADIVTYGVPVLPGAMFMLAYLGDVPIMGLLLHARRRREKNFSLGNFDAGRNFARRRNANFYSGIVVGVCRRNLQTFYTYMPGLLGGKNWTLFSTALLLLPIIGPGPFKTPRHHTTRFSCWSR